MPVGLIAGIGGGLSLFGSLMQMRNNRRLRRDANNLSLDTSELEALSGRLQGVDIEGRALRDTRAAGIGFDQDQFTQNAAVRGAGRNSFGVLRQEAQERGQQDFATAAQGRMDQLRDQNYQQQLGTANSLIGARQGLLSARAGLLGQASSQSNAMWGGIADLGAAGVGLAAESYMTPPGQTPPGSRHLGASGRRVFNDGPDAYQRAYSTWGLHQQNNGMNNEPWK